MAKARGLYPPATCTDLADQRVEKHRGWVDYALKGHDDPHCDGGSSDERSSERKREQAMGTRRDGPTVHLFTSSFLGSMKT